MGSAAARSISREEFRYVDFAVGDHARRTGAVSLPRAVEARGDPEPLPYLKTSRDGAFKITLEVWLRSAKMEQPVRVSQSDFASLYWTLGQLIAHHTSNGCPLRPGDLIGSGTVSGPENHNQACLLEMTRRGAEPLTLPTGETRVFVEDGDEVILRGLVRSVGISSHQFGRVPRIDSASLTGLNVPKWNLNRK